MSIVFFFNDTATTEIYTLSLHDALPISALATALLPAFPRGFATSPNSQLEPISHHPGSLRVGRSGDRKSTRLNSSHGYISYAVFCLKKKQGCEYDELATEAPRHLHAPPR